MKKRIATLDLTTTLILLLSFGYERYLYQRTMKTVMELQGKLESYGKDAPAVLCEMTKNSKGI